MSDWDEVEDPEWLLTWSLGEYHQQRLRGGYYFGPMFTVKSVDHCDEAAEYHLNCWDFPANTEAPEITSTRVSVRLYDEDGEHVGNEYINPNLRFGRHRRAA